MIPTEGEGAGIGFPPPPHKNYVVMQEEDYEEMMGLTRQARAAIKLAAVCLRTPEERDANANETTT